MTLRGPRPEGMLERLARMIVADELGVTVDRYDDGTAHGQPDGMIRLPVGDAPLEVVSDEDSAYNRQDAALRQRGRTIKALDHRAWWVSITSDADVRRLHRELPAAIDALEPDPYTGDYELTDELVQLGVSYIAIAQNGAVGAIYLSHEGYNSWDDPADLNTWVLRVLAREHDVAAKLATFGGAERHAFVWARFSSPWDVNGILARDDEDLAEPFAAPELPAGITHLWVASTMTRRGCLVAHQGRWRRTKWITTEAAE